MVRILPSSTSKGAPNPRCFNDFNFQIALARRRGANFVGILGSRSSATPVFRTYLCEPLKRQNYGKTQHFAQILPAKISHVSHPCCKTSLLSNIDAARPTGDFQYSRKLELLNFLWWYHARQVSETTHGYSDILSTAMVGCHRAAACRHRTACLATLRWWGDWSIWLHSQHSPQLWRKNLMLPAFFSGRGQIIRAQAQCDINLKASPFEFRGITCGLI